MSKRVNAIKILVDDEEFKDISVLSMVEQRAIADLCHIALRFYLYGNAPALQRAKEVTKSSD